MPISRRTVLVQEEWRKVPSDDGLEASNLGRIRRNSILLTAKEQIKINNTTARIGRAVLEAFVGPCPDGMECCHRDDDPTNNILSNLRWDTQSGNAADRWNNNGRKEWSGAVEHGNSKMTRSKVVLVRLLHKFNPDVWTIGTLSNVMVVGYYAIHKILKRKNWKKLP